MTAPGTELFKGRHFDREVIILCIRWYVSYKLSSRELVEMMGERAQTGTYDDSALGAAICAGIREAMEPVRTKCGRFVAL